MEFILDEHDILAVKAVEELLKNQLIEAIDEDYVLELWEGRSGYSGRTLLEILKHLHAKNVVMDDAVRKEFLRP